MEYVAGTLRTAGYDVTVQPFDFSLFTEISPAQVERTAPTPRTYTADDVVTMEYSGSGTVSAAVTGVELTIPPSPEPSSTSGCEATDFAGFPAGNVALVQRGTCDFAVKAVNAQAAGASAVILMNEGQPGRTDAFGGTLGGPVVTIPVVSASFEAGAELAGLTGAVVGITTTTSVETTQTANVIADTRGGNPDRTVVVGSHLDSVAEGPGINDNGSGSSTTLELAVQLGLQEIEPTNKVRFAFWGAEESGLVGSQHYVSTLPADQLEQIELNLNFDMVGSPNYVRFVYDGNGDATGVAGPEGSAGIEQTFTDYFTGEGLASDPTEFSGRSDYGPFIEVGIPAGGLFSGAEGIKTPEQAATYGGTAGEAYDPCYHLACDTTANINATAIDQFSDAAAHATLVYAMSPTGVTPPAGEAPSTRVDTTVTSGSLPFKGDALKR